MPVLKSSLDVAGPGFARNRAAMQALLDELADKTATAALGGPEAARLRHASSRWRIEPSIVPGGDND